MPQFPGAGRAPGREAWMGLGWRALSCRPCAAGGDSPGAGDTPGPGQSVASPQPKWMRAASQPQTGGWWGKQVTRLFLFLVLLFAMATPGGRAPSSPLRAA